MVVFEGRVVARDVPPPRLFWQVTAFDRYGVELASSLHRSLSAAYRRREYLLRHVPVVVVEVVS